jgi:hypothetical protein
MREAPADGYKPEFAIDLTPERIRSNEFLYFYFRVGGKYGRGSVGGIQFAKDHGKVSVWLSLDVQPDGSRNLDTGE